MSQGCLSVPTNALGDSCNSRCSEAKTPSAQDWLWDPLWPLCHLNDACQEQRPVPASACAEGGAGRGSVSSADVEPVALNQETVEM